MKIRWRGFNGILKQLWSKSKFKFVLESYRYEARFGEVTELEKGLFRMNEEGWEIVKIFEPIDIGHGNGLRVKVIFRKKV
jgi:hypothetical protein